MNNRPTSASDQSMRYAVIVSSIYSLVVWILSLGFILPQNPNQAYGHALSYLAPLLIPWESNTAPFYLSALCILGLMAISYGILTLLKARISSQYLVWFIPIYCLFHTAIWLVLSIPVALLVYTIRA